MMVMMIVTVVMAAMIMIVRVMMRGLRCIRAALGIERSLDWGQARAQTFQQGFQQLVPSHPQPICQNLHRSVAIPEVPGESRQVCQIVAANLDQRLRFGHHIDETAVVKLQQIAVAQQHGLGKHDPDGGAFHAG